MENRVIVWDKPVPVDEKWIESVDANVLKQLPPGTQVQSIQSHGISNWNQTAKIVTKHADGSSVSYFIKVSKGDVGKSVVSAEFVSMSSLHAVVPYFVPAPIAWGTYSATSYIHFFLCEFVEMDGELPDRIKFAEAITDLHSKGISPNGKYGFSVPTYQGNIPQHVEWSDTWEEFFYKSLKKLFQDEENTQGPDPEVQALEDGILTKVVPRLLRPLETGGRTIQPCLIHSDIWDGNTSTNMETNNPVIFDAACIYAHHEMELAPLRPERHIISEGYIPVCVSKCPKSEPRDDFDDRIALYCLRFDMVSSALYPGKLVFREIAVETMKNLVSKFPGGYETWAKEHGEVPVSRPWDKPLAN